MLEDALSIKKEHDAKVTNNAYLIKGIDKSIFKCSRFVEVIGSFRTWVETSPSTLASVFLANVTHAGKWLEWAKKSE